MECAEKPMDRDTKIEDGDISVDEDQPQKHDCIGHGPYGEILLLIFVAEKADTK